MATLLNNIKDLVVAIAADIKDIRSSIPAPYAPPDSGVSASTYGNSTSVPVTTVDIKGRVTKVVNTTIRAASTAVTGIVKLNNTVTSTSSNEAATASAVKTAYDLANAAIPKTDKGKINGVASLGANGKVLTAQLPETSGGGGAEMYDGTSVKFYTVVKTISRREISEYNMYSIPTTVIANRLNFNLTMSYVSDETETFITIPNFEFGSMGPNWYVQIMGVDYNSILSGASIKLVTTIMYKDI